MSTLLCIDYGPNASIIPRLREALGPTWKVESYNPLSGFLYWRMLQRRIPNPTPSALRAIWHARRKFGRDWRSRYPHTVYIFDALSRRALAAVARIRPSCVLQVGALFSSAGAERFSPYFLYLDHTRALDARYQPYPGLPAPLPTDPELHERERRLYQAAEAIFTMSKYVRESVIADYSVDSARVHVVGTGPDVFPVSTPGRSKDPKSFLFVGIDFVRKGGPILLRAYEKVRSLHPDTELWIAGGYRSSLPTPGVKCLGRLSVRELEDLYANAFVFVLPTLREPFGRVYLEAMAFGLPCIGTSVGAVPEIIVDGETGLLVPAGDEGSLVNAMVRLLESPALAASMGKAGRERLHQHFGWDRATERIATFLRIC